MKITVTLTVLLVFSCISYTYGDCKFLGSIYKTGEVFTHPENGCSKCICCVSEKCTCTSMACTNKDCGILRKNTSADGCCKECDSACTDESCTPPDVQENRYAYHPESCCPTKGCDLSDADIPCKSVPEGSFGACGRCTCHANGTHTCSKASCTDGLECVNPKATQNGSQCVYECPDGPTCRRSGVMIKRNELTKIGLNYCMCNPNAWSPRGYCTPWYSVSKAINALFEHKCVEDPRNALLSIVNKKPKYIDYQDSCLEEELRLF